MSWLSGWSDRIAVCVVGATVATKDVQIKLTSVDRLFWAKVQSTGADIRITAADGVTVVTQYARGAWSFAAQTATLDINDYVFTAAGDYLFWIYIGNSAATDVSSAFAPAAPLSGYTDPARHISAYTVTPLAEQPGTTRPRQVIRKAPDDQLHVWIDCSNILEQNQYSADGNIVYEEISYIEAVYSTTAGVVTAFVMYESTETRFFDQGMKLLVKSGVDGVNYTIRVKFITTTKRTLNAFFEVQVKNATEQ